MDKTADVMVWAEGWLAWQRPPSRREPARPAAVAASRELAAIR